LSGGSGINATGNLHELHYLTLLAGLVIVVGVHGWRTLDNSFRAAVWHIFTAFIALLAPLILLQYFTTGEARYYLVKVSQLVEVMFWALGVAVLARSYAVIDSVKWTQLIFVPLIPVTVGLLFVSPIVNPLRETRELLKDYSGMEKPAHYEADVQQYIYLGKKGQLHSFNAMSMHYNSKKHIFEGYMQLPYWSNLMQLSAPDVARCNDTIYANLAYVEPTDASQRQLFSDIKRCAADAKRHGWSYFVVTDERSAGRIRMQVDPNSTLVY
jgi:hypothetical protein